jgi:hypothetical protein
MSAQERGGATCIIGDVDRAGAKTATKGMAAIGRDAVAVVSTRGTVAGRNGTCQCGAKSLKSNILRLSLLSDEKEV